VGNGGSGPIKRRKGSQWSCSEKGDQKMKECAARRDHGVRKKRGKRDEKTRKGLKMQHGGGGKKPQLSVTGGWETSYRKAGGGGT